MKIFRAVPGLVLGLLSFSIGYAGGPSSPNTGFPDCCTPPKTGTYPCAAPGTGSWSKSQCLYGCQVNCGDSGEAVRLKCRQGCAQYDTPEPVLPS